jgi:DNA (cytosine-5)-methyltransferase 1
MMWHQRSLFEAPVSPTLYNEVGMSLSSLELCAGAGGQALGLELAGFDHVGLVENDVHACSTLRLNRPQWRVIEQDLNRVSAVEFRGVDLVAAGLPCPPFSVAGKQLGEQDERNLFPAAMRIIDEVRPKAVLIENVRGFLDASFQSYRQELRSRFKALGYQCEWKLLNASDFGVSQLRPRVVIVAMKPRLWRFFRWPEPMVPPLSVGELLYNKMVENSWRGAASWKNIANHIAPTVVGGSKKHGGPDLGPTRSRVAWAALGVDGSGIANQAPESDFVGMPKLTVDMVALLQGFPADWKFAGRKTNAYRQVGNAFPPPVACAVGRQIASSLKAELMRVAS